MFVDELEIRVRAGKGGNGCVCFLRDAKTLRGGPNGGDGGDGGDVVLLPTTHCNTLFHLTGRGTFAAQNGGQGLPQNCGGKDAVDLVIEVPVGTLVLDAERHNVLQDLDTPDRPWVLARGGHGGRGNTHFATATHRTPREAERGKEGEARRVLLSLKLIADVGLLGLPNAGKSTLLATLTKARPKIAGYPFTTLEPILGIAQGPGEATFVIADIPGLIEGASRGKGLGDKFLKHIERTRVLLHLIDCGDLPSGGAAGLPIHDAEDTRVTSPNVPPTPTAPSPAAAGTAAAPAGATAASRLPKLRDFLRIMVKEGASDLVLKANGCPSVRVAGVIRFLGD